MRLAGPGLAAALSGLVLALGAPNAGAAPTKVQSPNAITLPPAFIAGWDQGAVRCPTYTDLPWVFWKTYAIGAVGDRWTLWASSKLLCKGSRRAAHKILAAVPSHLGATFERPAQEIVAVTTFSWYQEHNQPMPLAAKWAATGHSCRVLPSSYSVGYFRELESTIGGSEDEVAWTRAVGITASYVICFTAEHPKGKKLTGSSYFAFGPQATDCALVYTIKEDRPDPEFPGQMIAPPVSEANIWNDYSQGSCTPG